MFPLKGKWLLLLGYMPNYNVDSFVVHTCLGQTFCYGNYWERACCYIVEPLSANRCCCRSCHCVCMKPFFFVWMGRACQTHLLDPHKTCSGCHGNSLLIGGEGIWRVCSHHIISCLLQCKCNIFTCRVSHIRYFYTNYFLIIYFLLTFGWC